MRIYTTVLRQLVSSKKFYDIVKTRKYRNIPKTAEEVIISKYLKDNATLVRNSMQTETKKVEKPNNKIIAYQQFMRESPNGSIIQTDYKNTHLHMVSLNYQNIKLPDIHQICEKVNPDLVFVQARPEPYIKNFQLLPKIKKSFSDLKYLLQLCLSSQSIKQSLLTPQLTQKLEGMLGIDSNEKIDQKVFIHDNKDLVDDDVVMMASYYCSSKSKTLLFGELPEQPWREWLCNSHTLMELQEIYKHICKNIPFYQSLKLSPYRLAALLRPQLFLNLRDRYMGTLIEMAIATQKYKKILCFMGVGENLAVEQLLLNDLLMRGEGNQSQFTPVIEYLIGPEIKHSILRNTEGWEIIEKHIIMDLLHHGEAVLSEPLEAFPTTNKVADYYGRILNEYSEQTMLQFRYDKTLSYLNIMKEKVAQGGELKRKFMLREALRSPSLDI